MQMLIKTLKQLSALEAIDLFWGNPGIYIVDGLMYVAGYSFQALAAILRFLEAL